MTPEVGPGGPLFRRVEPGATHGDLLHDLGNVRISLTGCIGIPDRHDEQVLDGDILRERSVLASARPNGQLHAINAERRERVREAASCSWGMRGSSNDPRE